MASVVSRAYEEVSDTKTIKVGGSNLAFGMRNVHINSPPFSPPDKITPLPHQHTHIRIPWMWQDAARKLHIAKVRAGLHKRKGPGGNG